MFLPPGNFRLIMLKKIISKPFQENRGLTGFIIGHSQSSYNITLLNTGSLKILASWNIISCINHSDPLNRCIFIAIMGTFVSFIIKIHSQFCFSFIYVEFLNIKCRSRSPINKLNLAPWGTVSLIHKWWHNSIACLRNIVKKN